MMFCQHCGKQMHETAIACPQCGAMNAHAQIAPKPATNEGPIWLAISSMTIGIVDILIAAGVPDSQWDRDTNTGFAFLACIALVLGIVSVKCDYRGKGMAIAGIVLSALALVIAIGWAANGRF